MSFGEIVKTAWAAICVGCAWFFGPWDAALLVLVVLVAVDYAMGVSIAVVNKNVSSAVGLKGIVKKVVMLLLVGVASLLDKVVPSEGVLRTATCLFFIANEGISILENAGTLGVPLPPKLLNVLEQIKSKSEKTE